jgi:hypothetical protein
MLGKFAILPMLLLAPGTASAEQAATVPGTSPIAPIIAGKDGAPYYLVGITAYGKAEDLVRLAQAAGSNGWPSRREAAGQPPSLMIAFPKADPAKVSDFLRRSEAGY